MIRSPSSELAERINTALFLLRKSYSKDEVVSAIMDQFGVSRRQAYRYIQEAQRIKRKMPIPEQKVVFTVKLPKSLVSLIRQFANSTGETLSSIVTQADDCHNIVDTFSCHNIVDSHQFCSAGITTCN